LKKFRQQVRDRRSRGQIKSDLTTSYNFPQLGKELHFQSHGELLSLG